MMLQKISVSAEATQLVAVECESGIKLDKRFNGCNQGEAQQQVI